MMHGNTKLKKIPRCVSQTQQNFIMYNNNYV